MQTAVRNDPDDVKVALNQLGVSLEILQEAVQQGYSVRISRTENDAPNAPGLYQWNDTLRSLRENMALCGWQRCDHGNWSTTVHPERKLAIAVSSGNHNTGNRYANPSTKTAKGPRTEEAVSTNAKNQLQSYFPDMEPLQNVQENEENYPTWWLLFYVDKEELRAELSLPVKMDCDGHINEWCERIILPATPLNPLLIITKPDFGPDVDIKIARKA